MGGGLFVKSQITSIISGGMKKHQLKIYFHLHTVKKFIQMRNDTVKFFDNIEEERKVKAIGTDENNGTMRRIERFMN